VRGLFNTRLRWDYCAHERDARAHVTIVATTLPRQLRSTERSILRPRVRFGRVKRPALLRIEDRDIGMAAANQRAPPSQAEHARRAGSEEFDNPAERDLLSAVKVSDGEAERSLEPGDPKSSALELNDLLVRSVGRMVSGDGVDRAIGQATRMASRSESERRGDSS
jgi:hypothetical protein